MVLVGDCQDRKLLGPDDPDPWGGRNGIACFPSWGRPALTVRPLWVWGAHACPGDTQTAPHLEPAGSLGSQPMIQIVTGSQYIPLHRSNIAFFADLTNASVTHTFFFFLTTHSRLMLYYSHVISDIRRGREPIIGYIYVTWLINKAPRCLFHKYIKNNKITLCVWAAQSQSSHGCQPTPYLRLLLSHACMPPLI